MPNEANVALGQPPETRPVDPLTLKLDPNNPRLRASEQGRDQASLLDVMVTRFKVDELAESIIAAGFTPFDPILAWQNGDELVVLEGNRRIAAMQLLLDPERAPAGRRDHWRQLSQRLPTDKARGIRRVDVQIYLDRNAVDVSTYIGFRHVTGVLKWAPLEKAQFIAHLVDDEKWSYRRIAERLGSYAKYVERHYVAFRLVRQLVDSGIPGTSFVEDSFGVLMRALQAEGIAEFIGVSYPDDPERSRKPVTEDRLDNLTDFVAWTFGTDEKKRILPDSRRLTDLGQILRSPEALAYLRRADDPRFDRAFFRSGGEAQSVAEWLLIAADRLEECVPLVSKHVDNQDVAAGVGQATRFMVQIAAHFPKIAEEYGIASR